VAFWVRKATNMSIGKGRSETIPAPARMMSNWDALPVAADADTETAELTVAYPVRSGARSRSDTAAANGSVLLLGNYRPTLTLARTFSALGRRVIVTDGPEGIAQFSRFVDECWHSPPLHEPADFFEALRDFLNKRRDITVVYPVLEVCLRNFPRYAHLLPSDRLYVLADDATIENCLSKPKMMALACDAGVLCGSHVKVTDYATLLDAVRPIGFPLIVKPSNSSARMGTRKAVIAGSLSELTEALPEWPANHNELIVQAYIDGPRINLYFAAQNGVAIRYLAAEIMRTDEEDGTGLAVDGRTIELDAEVRSIGDRLLSGLGYHGIGCIQMLRDRQSGKHYFIELNPRIAGNHAVPEHCGMGLGVLGMQLAQGIAVDGELKIGPAGKRYVWTSAALDKTWKAARSGRISWAAAARRLAETMKAAVVADVHMNWDRRDPAPAIAELVRKLPLVHRLRKHIAKRLKRVTG
jgi:predicted ATP-grasp superfamily ATP-dependent carboligase